MCILYNVYMQGGLNEIVSYETTISVDTVDPKVKKSMRQQMITIHYIEETMLSLIP